jgi:hypothetical protein
MKEDILKKFGLNKGDRQFPEVKLSDGSRGYCFYIHRGFVYILDNQGMDNNFDDYPVDDQILLYKAIMKI